jgi:phage gp29-like protein
VVVVMTLYDAYGRPVDTQALRQEQAAPTLAGVRNIYSIMHPAADLSPEKLVAVLRTAELGDPWLYLEMAEDMEERDLHYLSVLSTRKHAVSQLELSVQAASDSKEDRYASDLVRDVLIDGPLEVRSALFDILDSIGKGFSATEIIWNTEGAQWFPERLEARDPRWFMFDWISGRQVLVRTLTTEGPEFPQYGSQTGITGRDARATGQDGTGHLARPAPWMATTSTGAEIGIQPATAPLKPFKFITHIARAKSGLPIRGGIARLAAWAYLFKNYVLKDWVGFAETFGQPLRVGKYGPGATEEDKSALLKAVASIGTDAAAIIPQAMLIEFVEAKGKEGTDIYERFCDWIDRQVSKGVLGQTLTTELPKGGGSRAAAQVHDMVRHDIAQDDAQRLAASLNRDLVKPLLDLNLGPQKNYPRITIGFPKQEDLAALSTGLAPFIDRGLRVEERAIREKFGLSEPAQGQAVLHPLKKETERVDASPAEEEEQDQDEGAALGGGPAALWTDVDARHAVHRRGGAQPYQDKIDRFVAALREESDAAMAPIIRPLIAEMRNARSYDAMKAALVKAVAKMDPSKFVELMARAGFAVNVAGNLGIGAHDTRRRGGKSG